MLYSALTNAFYDPQIHGIGIPADAVPITTQAWQDLLAGQATGLHITADASGYPVLVEPPALPLDHPALIAARRYQAETRGISVNGMPLDTGRDSQALVTGAALAAVLDPAYSCQWKTAAGAGFITLNAQQIIALAGAMRAHVQACFDREAELLAALEAGTYTDEQLEQGWPS